MAEVVESFNQEATLAIIKESCESLLNNQAYHHTKVTQWNSQLIETILKKLTQQNKPYKYIVTCVIMQRNGAGIHASSSCYWDAESDGSICYKYESRSMYCIVNVFGVAV